MVNEFETKIILSDGTEISLESPLEAQSILKGKRADMKKVLTGPCGSEFFHAVMDYVFEGYRHMAERANEHEELLIQTEKAARAERESLEELAVQAEESADQVRAELEQTRNSLVELYVQYGNELAKEKAAKDAAQRELEEAYRETHQLRRRTDSLERKWKGAEKVVKETKGRLQLEAERARTDGLTGLFNKRHFEYVLEDQMKRAQSIGSNLSLIIFDLDFFKGINDRYGHPCGDVVLKKTSEGLKANVRDEDIPARYGGEEFAVILPDTEITEAASIAERLRTTFRDLQHEYQDPKSSRPIVLKVTASFGVSAYSPGKTIEQMVDEADQALYQSKEAGRNAIHLCRAAGGRYTFIRYNKESLPPVAKGTPRPPAKAI